MMQGQLYLGKWVKATEHVGSEYIPLLLFLLSFFKTSMYFGASRPETGRWLEMWKAPGATAPLPAASTSPPWSWCPSWSLLSSFHSALGFQNWCLMVVVMVMVTEAEFQIVWARPAAVTQWCSWLCTLFSYFFSLYLYPQAKQKHTFLGVSNSFLIICRAHLCQTMLFDSDFRHFVLTMVLKKM